MGFDKGRKGDRGGRGRGGDFVEPLEDRALGGAWRAVDDLDQGLDAGAVGRASSSSAFASLLKLALSAGPAPSNCVIDDDVTSPIDLRSPHNAKESADSTMLERPYRLDFFACFVKEVASRGVRSCAHAAGPTQ